VFAVTGLFILVAINLYINGNAVSVITIGAFTAAAYKIIPGIVKILNSTGQIKAYSFTVNNLLPIKQPGSIIFEDSSITSVEFQNIFFNYHSGRLLADVSFKIEKGDFVGIVGGSGKGKTTLLNVALGFLTPCSGITLINGKREEFGLKQYRNKISYVKQQPFFINDSVAFNISLKENYDGERLEKVMAVTGVNDIVSSHAEGVYTTITENGKNFSGGQRQRLAFARALYKNADILMLDEPFSELDNASERCLLEFLKKMAGEGKIILLVTHNKESLSFCNKIIDLDKE
jgi:ABC-type bacteriocin/lantibiotic exporter with double-glycine peptidase domain